MSLDAFANSMDSVFAEPSGVSNSSLSMRANTDYDMDDFTGRHEHKVGGTYILRNLKIIIIIIFSFLPLQFAVGSNHDEKAAWFLIVMYAIASLLILRTFFLYFSENQDTKCFIFLIIIVFTIMFANSIQVQQNPMPGVWIVILCLAVFVVCFGVACYKTKITKIWVFEDEYLLFKIVFASILVSLLFCWPYSYVNSLGVKIVAGICGALCCIYMLQMSGFIPNMPNIIPVSIP